MNEHARHVSGGGEAEAPRHLTRLLRGEALRLLGTVSLGRIVFTHQALPAVRPVNHLVDGGDVIVRLHDGASAASVGAPADGPGVVVAYEADVIDPDTHLGWSVVVTGYARHVADLDALSRYRTLLRPWVAQTTNDILRIRPDIVTGFRITVLPAPATPAPAGAQPPVPGLRGSG
ncbi:pyridoxamine 5'-phosphate oxidase family protein [Streptomyces sp. NPDC004726]